MFSEPLVSFDGTLVVQEKKNNGHRKEAWTYFFLKALYFPGVVVRAYNPSTQEVDAGRWRILDQPGLYSKTL
jgi:hypothetical protein